MRLHSLLLLVTAAFACFGCTTALSPDDQAARADLTDTVRSAYGVYHCAIDHSTGSPRFTLLATWRHAAARGPAPALGTEILPRTKKSLPATGVTSVIVFLFDPPVLMPNGHMMSNRTVFVFDREVPSFRATLVTTESLVRALERQP